MTIKNSQPIPFPLLFPFLILSGIDGLNENLFAVHTLYIFSSKWPYPVSADVAIDGKKPLFIDMQDHSPTGTIDTGGNASVASKVVGQWTSPKYENQIHTINLTVPQGGNISIVDAFV